jgi:hypothetical protein
MTRTIRSSDYPKVKTLIRAATFGVSMAAITVCARPAAASGTIRAQIEVTNDTNVPIAITSSHVDGVWANPSTPTFVSDPGGLSNLIQPGQVMVFGSASNGGFLSTSGTGGSVSITVGNQLVTFTWSVPWLQFNGDPPPGFPCSSNATNGFVDPNWPGGNIKGSGGLASQSGDGPNTCLFSFGLTGSAPTTLSLNNWTAGPFGTGSAGVLNAAGIVRLKGAIGTTSGGAAPFTLPTGFRPPTDVYVPVDLCNATLGRLLVESSGAVTIEAEGGAFSEAQCFTSLEGVSFAASSKGFTALTLANGWTNAPFGTRNAAVINDAGTIRFQGAIGTGGTNAVPFTLPSAFRPPTSVYVPVDLCNTTKGRLYIQSNGVVTVQVENGAFADAQCFTSLEGASFPLASKDYTALTLQNGWKNAPFGTRNAAAKYDNDGNVRFQGAVASGTSAQLFTLPAGLRPAVSAYVNVDLCNAAQGRLQIAPSGAVTVEERGGTTLSDAQCFTSLEGASFALGK